MANPNAPQESSPSISAADLRRRLLASTPPPIAAVASSPGYEEPEPVEEESAIALPSWATSSQQDLLARLRMPGTNAPVPVPSARQPVIPPAPILPTPTPTRPAVNRRTPIPTNSRFDPSSAIAGALNQLAGLPEAPTRYPGDDSPHAEIQRLKTENKELRTLLGEMKHLLQEASDTEQQLVAKDKEFQATLEAKDAQIEELSVQLVAIEEKIEKGELAPPPPVPKTRSELEEWADELEKENAKIHQDRKRLDDERRQLREDEEALETQMREMEVAMARERALIARQETELRRLSAEIQHELELVQRGDTSLRDQMVKFQRRAQEVLVKPPGGGPNQNGRR